MNWNSWQEINTNIDQWRDGYILWRWTADSKGNYFDILNLTTSENEKCEEGNELSDFKGS